MEKKIIGSFTCPTCGTTHTIITSSESCTHAETSSPTPTPTPMPVTTKPMTRSERRLAALKEAGIAIEGYASVNVGGIDSIVRTSGGRIEVVTDDDPIFDAIKNNGATYNSHLFKQYVMAHLLRDSWDEDVHNISSSKMNEYIRKFTDVRRMFEILLDKTKGLVKMKLHGDYDSEEEESKWYNHELGVKMIAWYINKFLPEYIGSFKVRHHKKREYKLIPGAYAIIGVSKYKYKGVYVDEIESKIYDNFNDILEHYRNAIDYSEECNALRYFIDHMINANHVVSAVYNRETHEYEYIYRDVVCKEFIDAFKGYGAYFCGKNMIMFHGLIFDGNKTTEESLAAWREYAIGHQREGWWMFGALKQMIEDNHYDYLADLRRWREEAVARRNR